jgi:hypothetical protein
MRSAREYEGKAEGLGELFISEVEAATTQIEAYPASAPAFGRHLRRKILSRFPYTILYAVGTDVIRVVGIMHQHRGPEFIARRLRVEGIDENDA